MTTPDPVPYWPPPPIDVLDRTNATKAKDQHPKDHDDLQVAVNAMLLMLGAKPYGKSDTLSAELVRLDGQSAGGVDSRITTLEQQLNDLLHPYQSPGVGLTVTGLPDTVEVGRPVTGAFTFAWSSSNAGNVKPASLVLRGPGGAVLASGLAPTDSVSVPVNQVRTTPGSASWSLTGVGVKGESFGAGASVTWSRRIYTGTSTSPSLTGTDVANLPGSLSGSAAGTYAMAPGGFKYFAFPEAYGTVSGFTDVATQLSVTMDEASPQVLSVTNAYGVTTAYRLYRTKYQLGGAITVRVS